MKSFKTCLLCFLVCCLGVSFLPLSVSAQIPHPNTYIHKLHEIHKYKNGYDDPRPVMKDFGLKQILPKEIYEKICYNEEEMKRQWAEVVGFRAPDVVGKIAPEIKPGKYTYKDLGKYPGLKELMWDSLYKRIRPGGPPFAGNIPEFEIIPTRQYYWSLPIAEATKRNVGKTKLDKDGYIISETLEAGYPFPQPSGEFKAQQIMYNIENRYFGWEQNNTSISLRSDGYTKDLRRDNAGAWYSRLKRMRGQTMMPPFGWYDERAKKQMEKSQLLFAITAPRDISGAVQAGTFYTPPDKLDSIQLYIPSMRRVRKMSATDGQDPVGGGDLIYDDQEGFNHKLSPTHYPYKYEVIAEREYLVVSPSIDGSEYVTSKGLEFKNIKMERRPIWVVKLTQKDPNYVYKERYLYVDKEYLHYTYIENYDQRGRLYRTCDASGSFHPESGMFSIYGWPNLFRDHIDMHSTVVVPFSIPAYWRREDLSIEGVISQK